MCEISEQIPEHWTPDSSGPDHYIVENLHTDFQECREGAQLKEGYKPDQSLPGIAYALPDSVGCMVAPPHPSREHRSQSHSHGHCKSAPKDGVCYCCHLW